MISCIQIPENEIVDILHILYHQKASGPDRICYKMLKMSPEKIALRIIFNKSLAQGKYPLVIEMFVSFRSFRCAPLAKRHKISITRGRSPGLSQERM